MQRDKRIKEDEGPGGGGGEVIKGQVWLGM